MMQRIVFALVAAMVLSLPFTFATHTADAAAKKRIVVIGGRDSHGNAAHNWGEGTDLLVKALNEESGLDVEAVGYKGGYPTDPSIFKNAATVVILCDGGGRHLLLKNLKEFKPYMDAGVGLINIHYAVEVPKGDGGKAFLEWVGGYFETHWSVNPHWKAEFVSMPDHPITRGVKPFELNDEWYYHMRFRTQMKGVTPILSAHPPKDTLKRKDGAHSGNPAVRASVLERKEAQHVAWAYDRSAHGGKGRGFGITGAHYHKAWDNDSFRTCVLNAIAWTANIEVPKGGVKSLPNPTTRLKGKSVSGVTSSKKSKSAVFVDLGKATKNAKFASKVITKKTTGHAVEVKADIKGATDLYLVISDGGDGYSCDWADWAQPRLVKHMPLGGSVATKLTAMKWASASTGHGQVRINANAGGAKLSIGGKAVEYGIGAHANSVIHYKLPKNHGYTSFVATAGLDNGGTDQGACGNDSSVQFFVFTDAKAFSTFAAAKKKKDDTYVKRTGAAGRDAETELESMTVGEGLQAELFASEPTLTNPSNIDIDHAGRVWVAEIVNYRRHRNKQPEGDRILILEDTNGDGKADKRTVFYQEKDFMSPHGICVLATPDFKGTRVIVSVGDKVFNLYDDNGDGKADRKEIMFTGISGAQHDHGIHAFVFGPDGKLYFNFGNSGKQIRDKDGKPLTDKAGNVIQANRKPYQEGMVFRCNLDGSEIETLGWNFRNNWMATVDSFGTIWQSDNDDDGNKGVRINYVMEFGNYGYKDEFTGAAWRSKRPNMEKTVPEQHWHLNDPGVVPNLLQTYAGSPTGITIYEGTLLPKVFQGQIIHTDAGPNVCRAYPVKKDRAGYSAVIENVLLNTTDRWYRPSDVSVAPDGSLIIADWYDPGVGGHAAGDLERGRLFRITPKGHKGYKTAKVDVSTAAGAIAALKSPNYATRYVAYTALNNMKGAHGAKEALTAMAEDKNPRYRARALWLLSNLKRHAVNSVNVAINDSDADLRIMGIRLARQKLSIDMQMELIGKLASDKDAGVRRECAVAIRDLTHSKLSDSQVNTLADTWAQLAKQHDGKDRWYLEALGIAAARHWDTFFAVYMKTVGTKWDTPGGRDIVWRARCKAALPYLVKAMKAAADAEKPRYTRALDFHAKSPEKDAALLELLQ